MSLAERIIEELTRESAATRRLLERVPEEHLSWKPHAKSMSLSQLATHIANLPNGITRLASELDAEAPVVPLPELKSTREIVSLLDENVAIATDRISKWSDADLQAMWTLRRGGKALMTIPRIGVLRTVLLNHTYHHRGQLTVYLRLLDVALPAIYGSSADENLLG